jgi:hypothetical protein
VKDKQKGDHTLAMAPQVHVTMRSFMCAILKLLFQPVFTEAPLHTNENSILKERIVSSIHFREDQLVTLCILDVKLEKRSTLQAHALYGEPPKDGFFFGSLFYDTSSVTGLCRVDMVTSERR